MALVESEYKEILSVYNSIPDLKVREEAVAQARKRLEVKKYRGPASGRASALAQLKEQERLRLVPRLLTEEEIEKIIGSIYPPAPNAVGERIKTAIQQNIDRVLEEMLSTVKIAPIAIPDLAKEMKRQYIEARSIPGEAVGIRAGEAMGQPVTQMALNSFHTSGSSKNVSYGIEAIRELLRVSKDRKTKSMTISFNDKSLQYGEILKMRRDLVGITVGRLIQNIDILPTSDLMEEKPEWLEPYLEATGKTIPECKYYLHIDLNPSALFKYRVTAPRLVEVVENYCTEPEQEVVAVASPMGKRPILLIFPNEAHIQTTMDCVRGKQPEVKEVDIAQDDISYIYLQVGVIPFLQEKAFLQGVKGIDSIFPVITTVWRIVREDVPVYSPMPSDPAEKRQARRSWYLFYNARVLYQTGIPLSRLYRLLQFIGCEIVQTSDLDVEIGVEVRMPDLPSPNEAIPNLPANIESITDAGWKLVFGEEPSSADRAEWSRTLRALGWTVKGTGKTLEVSVSPTSYFNTLLSQKEKATEEKTRELKGKRMPELSELERLAYYGTAETNGSNMIGSFMVGSVDPYHTVSNNIREVYQLLGIEAVRNMLIKEFLDILSYQDAYIDPRHVVLIVDVMTNRGTPVSIDFNGASKYGSSLARAAQERALGVFRDVAGAGKAESASGSASALYFGGRPPIGTGGEMKILPSKALLEKMKAEAAKISEEDLSAGLDAVQKRPVRDRQDRPVSFARPSGGAGPIVAPPSAGASGAPSAGAGPSRPVAPSVAPPIIPAMDEDLDDDDIGALRLQFGGKKSGPGAVPVAPKPSLKGKEPAITTRPPPAEKPPLRFAPIQIKPQLLEQAVADGAFARVPKVRTADQPRAQEPLGAPVEDPQVRVILSPKKTEEEAVKDELDLVQAFKKKKSALLGK